MQYSPKLKKAMEEIKAILKKNDIAGFVVLHSPEGLSEFLNHVNPSYSCAFLQDGQIRVRLKTSEVGKEKAKQLAHDTFNMATHLADIISRHAMCYIGFQQMLKEAWNGEEGEAGFSSHETQNN